MGCCHFVRQTFKICLKYCLSTLDFFVVYLCNILQYSLWEARLKGDSMNVNVLSLHCRFSMFKPNTNIYFCKIILLSSENLLNTSFSQPCVQGYICTLKKLIYCHWGFVKKLLSIHWQNIQKQRSSTSREYFFRMIPEIFVLLSVTAESITNILWRFPW